MKGILKSDNMAHGLIHVMQFGISIEHMRKQEQKFWLSFTHRLGCSFGTSPDFVIYRVVRNRKESLISKSSILYSNFTQTFKRAEINFGYNFISKSSVILILTQAC